MNASRSSKAKDAAWMLARLAEAHKPRKAGDRVEGIRGAVVTIQSIAGEIATLSDGSQLHISKLRSAPEGQS